MQKLGLLGSYWALMISYVVFTLPVGTWTLKTYFDQLPDSLIESAKIDGAGNLRIMLRIIFPMAIPGMFSIASYGFVWSWNDLLYFMTLVTDTAKRTLTSGLVMDLPWGSQHQLGRYDGHEHGQRGSRDNRIYFSSALLHRRFDQRRGERINRLAFSDH